MRIVFCGTPDSAVPCLRSVAGIEGWEIAAVLTQPDRPVGRGRRPAPSPVKRAALDLGLAVHTPEKLKHVRSLLAELAPDVIAVVAYGHIFRRWLLELPRLGCVNVHFSLLPRHRGVAPVAWAILEGDFETGISTMRMERGVDTGPVYLTERTRIGEEETAGGLTERLAERAGPLLVQTLEGVIDGSLPAVPQEEEGATYARLLTKEDGLLDWTRPASELARRVRGLSPWPGAFTTYRGRNLKIHRAQAAGGELSPGTLRLERDRVEVGTGHGVLVLGEIQLEGKARMEGASWFRGARPRADEVLGRPG